MKAFHRYCFALLLRTWGVRDFFRKRLFQYLVEELNVDVVSLVVRDANRTAAAIECFNKLKERRSLVIMRVERLYATLLSRDAISTDEFETLEELLAAERQVGRTTHERDVFFVSAKTHMDFESKYAPKLRKAEEEMEAALAVIDSLSREVNLSYENLKAREPDLSKDIERIEADADEIDTLHFLVQALYC